MAFGPDIEHTHLHRLVLRQVLQEVHAVHIAIRVIEHELIDSRRVEEVRQHGLVALGKLPLIKSLPHALPKQKCQPIFAFTPSQHCAMTSLIQV